MKTMNVTNAREALYSLIDETNSEHEPIQILGKRGNAILISEKDWNAIQETLYLMGVPGMEGSVIEGMNTPIEQCSNEEDLDW